MANIFALRNILQVVQAVVRSVAIHVMHLPGFFGFGKSMKSDLDDPMNWPLLPRNAHDSVPTRMEIPVRNGSFPIANASL